MSDPAPFSPPSDETIAALRDALTAWFARGHRDLPWRRTNDPYAIWVSEIMLQQTRVETVAPRFDRWLRRFPTVTALANAPPGDVIEEWAGLGYYARARNLHAAAREVEARYGGRLPDDPDAVRALPGIGRYTAGAILSLAFHRREPILDGNVIRVLTRLFRIGEEPHGAIAQKLLWRLAERFVDGSDRDSDPSDINQGLMELGATVCSPRRPACPACPLAPLCEARREGDPERFPAASRAPRVQAVDLVSIALFRRENVLLLRRPPTGLWGGLLELPTGEPLPGEALAAAAARVARDRAGIDAVAPKPLTRFVHLLSHRRITCHAFAAEAEPGRVRRSGYDAHQWVRPDAAVGLGVSRATARMLAVAARRGTGFDESASGSSAL